MANYKVEFFEALQKNIRNLETKLTASTEGNLTRSQANTAYWADALLNTFKDMGDVIGMMGMIASCDFSQIREAEAKAQEKHDAELRTAVETVAHRLSEG